MWVSHPVNSNHEVVPRGPRIHILKLRQSSLHLSFYRLLSDGYLGSAVSRQALFVSRRSHRPARIVNRNEPFGSILESANSHFSILIVVFNHVAGRTRCAEFVAYGPQRVIFPTATHPAIPGQRVSDACRATWMRCRFHADVADVVVIRSCHLRCRFETNEAENWEAGRNPALPPQRWWSSSRNGRPLGQGLGRCRDRPNGHSRARKPARDF
jgi:hypothetical protein